MTKLGDVVEAIVDCEHRTAPIDSTGEFYAVGTPAMKGYAIAYEEARRISRQTFLEWTRRMTPRAGDLLLAREAPVGPVVMVPESANIAPGQRTVLMRPMEGHVDRRYLYYALRAPVTQDSLQEKAAGSTVSHLNVADLRSFVFPFPFPGFQEQRGIADVLGALDDKIAANRRIVARYRESLTAEFAMLSRSNAGIEVDLPSVVDLNPHVPKPLEADVTYLDMQKLPTSDWLIRDWGSRSGPSGTRFANGDTLLARITPCLENGKLGYVDFLHDGEVGVGSTEFIVIRPKAGIPRPVPYLIASSDSFRDFAVQHMYGTSGRQRVVAKDLAEYKLPFPDGNTLREFGGLAEGIFDHAGALRDESRTLAALRDTLLPPLMSGRLTVRDAESTLENVL